MGKTESMQIIMTGSEWRLYPECPQCIPMAMLNNMWAYLNFFQSLNRLRVRGGLSPDEALAIIQRRRWRKMDTGDAVAELIRYSDRLHITG